jgi:membrane-bound ClpP family serine protease
MIILGIILILLASLIPGIDGGGKRAMMICGIILLVLGVILLVAPNVLPAEHRLWVW